MNYLKIAVIHDKQYLTLRMFCFIFIIGIIGALYVIEKTNNRGINDYFHDKIVVSKINYNAGYDVIKTTKLFKHTKKHNPSILISGGGNYHVDTYIKEKKPIIQKNISYGDTIDVYYLKVEEGINRIILLKKNGAYVLDDKDLKDTGQIIKYALIIIEAFLLYVFISLIYFRKKHEQNRLHI